ncbi:unnamed protein product [Cylicocyclus nassatus]|uniref:Uncharacterized protein n=1 Tax=Cylicocyclus nassatus TaxID=53992 RepID=A0AA36GTU4_CYLNA|nr:unnamed protein product [Cylicocyclus nassatus]
MTELVWKSKHFDEYKALSPSTAKEITMGAIKFMALPDDVKEDFRKAFPVAAAFLISIEKMMKRRKNTSTPVRNSS